MAISLKKRSFVSPPQAGPAGYGPAQKAQISVIFRYVCESSCKIKEAFLGFDDVSDDRRASAIAEYIFKVLQKYNCVEKLVAQTYDGASVQTWTTR